MIPRTLRQALKKSNKPTIKQPKPTQNWCLSCPGWGIQVWCTTHCNPSMKVRNVSGKDQGMMCFLCAKVQYLKCHAKLIQECFVNQEISQKGHHLICHQREFVFNQSRASSALQKISSVPLVLSICLIVTLFVSLFCTYWWVEIKID